MSHITNRAISSAGFTTRDNVANVVHGMDWKYPHSWFTRFLSLINFIVPVLQANKEDNLLWKATDGLFNEFSYDILRHSIHLWLVMRRRLKTHDRLRQWDAGNYLNLNVLRYSLCNLHPDSHDHLFFECSFSSKVWSIVGKAAEMPSISPIWNDIISWLLPLSLKDNVSSIVGRLILASSAYFIWQERNNCIHFKPSRNEDQVAKIIVEMVRLKLASINFKNKE
ncbi:reverse transcriptase domain, reverse transcriptase zinc-binding domain protein [Tanacetum coccineum]